MQRPLLVLSMTLAACVPKSSDELDPETSSDTDTSVGDAPTAADTTADPPDDPSMTGAFMPTTTGDVTGEPGTSCPLEPSFTPLWSSQLDLPPPEGDSWIGKSLATLSDGRIATGGAMRTGDLSSAPGVFWIAPDGEPIGWTAGALTPSTELDTIGLRVADDDTVVLVGPQAVDDKSAPPYLSRFAPGGPELARVDVQVDHITWPHDFELRGADVVLSGTDFPVHDFWLAKVDGATGSLAWEISLPALDVDAPRHVAVGPDDEILAGAGKWASEGTPLFKVWRVDDAGAVLWERDLLEPGPGAGSLVDLVVTPAGHVVAATMWSAPTPKVTLIALALADGAPAWDLEVAVEDATGAPLVSQMFLDGDALALPISHAVGLWDGGTIGPHTPVLHRVSFAGAPLSTDLLTPGDVFSAPLLLATRGLCGDLVLFQRDPQGDRLRSFAP